MKRFMQFSLVLLGSVLAMSATSAPASDQAPAAQPGVGVEDLSQEVALLGQGGVVSQAPPCTACLAQAGACSGGAGTVCSKSPRCTCQWCGGSLVCRPYKKGPLPIPEG